MLDSSEPTSTNSSVPSSPQVIRRTNSADFALSSKEVILPMDPVDPLNDVKKTEKAEEKAEEKVESLQGLPAAASSSPPANSEPPRKISQDDKKIMSIISMFESMLLIFLDSS